ncbi:hypothetical protein BGX28_000636 [Mortierella sp. GBA30]|nr:hypothetical protein BGX28_000636 [Mortierella sp. GBA30]
MESQLRVLIVGAGIGGLMLGILLERACISYEIFEKTKELRPFGSAISLSGLKEVFEQLGMGKEFNDISKPFGGIHLYDEGVNKVGSFWSRHPGVDVKEHYGAYGRIHCRPDIVNLLLSRIPIHKVHFNKRVLKTRQENHSVIITCQDNTSYHGTILVGADGAYSSIRQNMYKDLMEAGTLPKEDAKPLGYDYNCVTGVTEPVDPALYPVVLNEFSEFEVTLGKSSPYSASIHIHNLENIGNS